MMKLGTQTASVINHLHSRGVIGQPAPVVGMGATMLGWTDRAPGTIFRVFKIGKLVAIEVRADNFECVKGTAQDGSAEYAYKTNVNGNRYSFRQDDAGFWQEVQFNKETKRWAKVSGGHGLRIGQRERYYDPSF